MKYLLIALLILFAVFEPKHATAQVTPTVFFCVGNNPQPPCATIPPSPSQTLPSGVSAVSPTILLASPAVQTSPSPSQTQNPSPTANSCAIQPTSISSQSNGTVQAMHHGKKHFAGHQGLLQQLFQFLLQLLQMLFQQLGITFPIPGTGSPCPTPSPSPTPSAAAQPSSSPSGVNTPSSVPSSQTSQSPLTSSAPALTAAPASGTQSKNCSPAPNATMTNTVSSKCGFPDTTNTGATGTLTTNPSGPSSNTGSGWTASGGTINVNTSGAVVKNVSLTGGIINVSASNVTIDNVKVVAGPGSFGISLHGANNVLIEHSTISGSNATSGRMDAGIKDFEVGNTYSANAVVKANNIYWVSTGVQIDHGTIQDNYIHDLGMISGDHLNGTTSNGGSDGVLLTIQHNTSFNPQNQTDAISLFEDFGNQQNRVINDNLVAGGGYCIYGGQNAGGPAASNIKITNNHFSRMYYPNCGSYGYIAAWPLNGSGGVWSGNVWDDTGATVGQ